LVSRLEHAGGEDVDHKDAGSDSIAVTRQPEEGGTSNADARLPDLPIHLDIDLETQEPPIVIEMFEVQFLEIENNSSTGTGTGSGVGTHPVAPVANYEPVTAASTTTANSLELSNDADAEEKTAPGKVAALISHGSDWCVAIAVIAIAVLASVYSG